MLGTGAALFAQPPTPGAAYLVYGVQESTAPDTLYRYDFATGEVFPVSEAGFDNVNALAAYCRGSCRETCSLYALQTGREVSVFPPRLPGVNLLKYDAEGAVTTLGPLSAPPLPPLEPMKVGLSSALNFIGAASAAGAYYIAGVAVKVDLLNNLALLDYKLYVGEIDLDNITKTAGKIDVAWREVTAGDCRGLLDDFVSQTIDAVNPLRSSVSGAIQDWALSRDEDALVSFLGFENAFLRIDLDTYTAACFSGPPSNDSNGYTGFGGRRTSELGGIFRDADGRLYAHQVDAGRLFLVDEPTGALTLVADDLPPDMRGDAASAKTVADVDIACNNRVNVSLDENCLLTITPDMVAEGAVCNESGRYRVVVYDGDPDPDDVVDRPGLFNYDLFYRPRPYGDEFVFLCDGLIHAEDVLPPAVSCPPPVYDLLKYEDENGDTGFTPAQHAAGDWFEDGNGIAAPLVRNQLICDDLDKILDVEASWSDPDYPYYTGTARAEDGCAGPLKKPVKVTDELIDKQCEYENGAYAYIVKRTFFFEDEKGNRASCDQYIYFSRPYIHLPVCTVSVSACSFEGTPTTDELLNTNLESIPFYINGICDTVYFTPDPSESGAFTTKGHDCNYSISYSDQLFSGVENCGRKILRTWSVLDWCRNPSPGDDHPAPVGVGDSYDSELHACYEVYEDAATAEYHLDPGSWEEEQLVFKQHIILSDEEAPRITCPGDDPESEAVTFSTGPFNCTAVVDLEDRLQITDNCSVKRARFKLEGFEQDPKTGLDLPVSYGWTSWNSFTLAGVPAGEYTLVVEAEDHCGNSGRATCPLIVIDQVEPVAICNDDLNISIGGPGTTNDGLARVTAAHLNEGSWDNCGSVELHVRRSIEDACVDLYLDRVEGYASLAGLIAVTREALRDLDGFRALPEAYPAAEVFYFDADPEEGAGATLVLLLEADGFFYTVWREAVFFTCCDVAAHASDRVAVELRATDRGGKSNTCRLEVLIEDKLPPGCRVPDQTILCTELDFDPAEPAQIAARFGAPEAVVDIRDNCGATITEAIDWEPDDCGTGTIIRSFTVTDASGRSTVCAQEIEVLEANDYEIVFPGDDESAECGVAPEGDISAQSFACDILAVSKDTTRFDASGTACFKLLITYNVINWCEYDDESTDPVEVPRDWDGDDDLGEAHTIRVAPNPARDLLEEVDGVQVVTWTQADGDLAWIDRADYLGDAQQIPVHIDGAAAIYVNRRPGFWQYSRLIEGNDKTAPVVEVENESLVFCAYGTPPDDCDGNFSIVFSTADDCTPGDVEVRSLKLDVFNAGNPQDLTGAPGYRLSRMDAGTYRLTGKAPVGAHTLVVTAFDGCGNITARRIPFEVTDCKPPAPICIRRLGVNLMPVDADDDGEVDGGMSVVRAADFIVRFIDDCSSFDGPEKVKYFAFKENDLEDGPASITAGMLNEENTSVTFTCEDVGARLVFVVALDAAGNYDYCTVRVEVQPGLDPSPCGPDEGEGAIAGMVTDEAVVPVNGVDVQLSGHAFTGYTTGNDGLYHFSRLIEGYDYSVTPGKDDNPLNGVSTFDLVLIAKHVLGLRKLESPYKLIAADANRSGSVTTLDLIHIRKLILSLSSGFPNNTSWRFIPADYEFRNPQDPFREEFPEFININDLQGAVADADFIAVKIGDVNGSARQYDLLSTDSRNGDLELFVEETGLAPGEEYVVDFNTTGLAGIEGYQFTIQYDPAWVELVDLIEGVAAEEHFGVFPAEGRLTTSWHPGNFPASLPEEARLFSLVLKAKGEATLSSVLRMVPAPTPAEAYSPTGETLGVTLNFGAGEAAAEGFELYQNEPNPFSTQTTIGFHLPEAARADIRVCDVTGRLLKVIDGAFDRGYNEVRLERNELPETGVLTYTIRTDRYTATRTMVVS